jgi:hypothetical protein
MSVTVDNPQTESRDPLIFHRFVSRNTGPPLYGIWSWIGFVISGLLIIAAIVDQLDYRNRWLCSKCGEGFIPEEPVELDVLTATNDSITPSSEEEMRDDQSGKPCSICGRLFPFDEFSYGNRDNRSYCQQCNREEKQAYSEGGVDAAIESQYVV